MILVAVVGEVGSGKTTILQQTSELLRKQTGRFDGFLAMAASDQPREGAQGSEHYTLHFLQSGERVLIATRKDEGGYTFEPEAFEKALSWANTRPVGQCEVALLDEFGKLEAQGEGHFPLLSILEAKQVTLAYIAVRASSLADLEGRLGRKFDLVLPVGSPKLPQALAKMAQKPRDWERVGIYGAGSGTVEMTLGSFLHGSQIPMRGVILSALQSLVLTSAAEGLGRKERVSWIAMIAAGLKAFSPTGSRVRPMLGISSQGAFYALTIRMVGWNFCGVVLAGAIVGGWAMAQGILLQVLFLGGDVSKAYGQVAKWLAGKLGASAPSFPMIAWCLVAFSAICGALVCGVFWKSRHRGLGRLQQLARRSTRATLHTQTPAQAFRGAIRDLLLPSFWIPVGIVILLAYSTQHKWDEALASLVRSITVGLLFFGLFRMVRPQWLIDWLVRHGHLGPAAALRRGLGLTDSDLA